MDLQLKRLLVAVDFSEGSRKALDLAAKLAQLLGAEILLVHVFEGVPGELKILEAAYVPTSFREEAQQTLREWQQHAARLGTTVRTVLREGSATDREIVTTAVENQVDLIVIGSHGRESLLVPNVVKKVLGRAPCPVLVVP